MEGGLKSGLVLIRPRLNEVDGDPPQLVRFREGKINEFVEHYNEHPKPFMWSATAESILAKIARLCKVINGTSH